MVNPYLHDILNSFSIKCTETSYSFTKVINNNYCDNNLL